MNANAQAEVARLKQAAVDAHMTCDGQPCICILAERIDEIVGVAISGDVTWKRSQSLGYHNAKIARLEHELREARAALGG